MAMELILGSQIQITLEVLIILTIGVPRKVIITMRGFRVSLMVAGVVEIVKLVLTKFVLFVLLHPTLISQITPTLGPHLAKPLLPLPFSQILQQFTLLMLLAVLLLVVMMLLSRLTKEIS